MWFSWLSVRDFRCYREVDLSLEPGPTAFVGSNGEGKTNLVEAVDYLARLGSHRAGSDMPLVRHGAERAVLRAIVVHQDREALLEVEINPGRSNRARLNRAPLSRARDLLGTVHTVLFAPEDLALAKGDPGERRGFLDDLLTLRSPRFAGVRADYDRVLRQRNTLLRTAGAARRGGQSADRMLSTLESWNAHLARTAAELIAARLDLLQRLRPLVTDCYREVAGPAPEAAPHLTYKSTLPLADGAVEPPSRDALLEAVLTELGQRREDELERGVTLVGPHRDDVTLSLGDLPVRGYASHGESWSFALALRLASYRLLRTDGQSPVLILDDVFAELDQGRRQRLADLVKDAEQLLVTAAVADDVPADLRKHERLVQHGQVTGG